MFRRKTRRPITLLDHHRRRAVLLRPSGILRRKIVLVVLTPITLLGLAVMAEVWPNPSLDQPNTQGLHNEGR